MSFIKRWAQGHLHRDMPGARRYGCPPTRLPLLAFHPCLPGSSCSISLACNWSPVLLPPVSFSWCPRSRSRSSASCPTRILRRVTGDLHHRAEMDSLRDQLSQQSAEALSRQGSGEGPGAGTGEAPNGPEAGAAASSG